METKTKLQIDELALIKAAFEYWKTLQQWDDADKKSFEFRSDNYLLPFKRAEYFVLIELDHDCEIQLIEFWDEDGEFQNEHGYKMIERW